MKSMNPNSVPSRPRDDGFFGRVYEKMLGVKENNRSEADIVINGVPTELKTKNIESNSKTSLFCKEPTKYVQGGSLRQLMEKHVNKYGKLNSSVRCGRENNKGLRLVKSDDKISLFEDEKEVCFWSLHGEKGLLARSREKMGTMQLGIHDSKRILEEKVYTGWKDEAFLNLLVAGQIVVEFRSKFRSNGSIRNRGTVFRTQIKNFGGLYDK